MYRSPKLRYVTLRDSYSYNPDSIKLLHIWEEKERKPPAWDKRMWPHPLLLTTDLHLKFAGGCVCVCLFSAPGGMGCCINYGTTCITQRIARRYGYTLPPFASLKHERKKKDMQSCPRMTTIIRFVFFSPFPTQRAPLLLRKLCTILPPRIAKR